MHRVFALNVWGAFVWSYATGDVVMSSPSLGTDGRVYVGSRDNRFYALTTTGTLAWSYATGKPIESSPAIGSGGGIYFGSDDNRLYALGPAGALSWSYVTDLPCQSSPAITGDGRLVVGSDDCVIYCIEAAFTPAPTRTPTSTGTPTRTPTSVPTATPPIDLTAQKVEFSTTDRIEVWADVRPLPVPCYPFVRIGMADGTTQYYVAGVGFTTDPTPYLGFEAGTTTLVDPILGYAVLAESFSGIPAGAYVLEGGAVDAVRTTSAENLVYFGGIDREPLTVR